MKPPPLPAFVNQFNDSKGAKWPKVSIDGHPAQDYTHVDCGAAVGLSAFLFSADLPIGAFSPATIREAAKAHQVEGLKALELAAGLRKLGAKATVLVIPPARFGKMLDDRLDLFLCLLVDDDAFPGCDPAFQGDHYVGIACGRNKLGQEGETLVPAYDPTCNPKHDQDGLPPGANWERLDKTVKAAQKWSIVRGYGNKITMVQVKRPIADEPADPQDKLIAKLRADLASSQDENDVLLTLLADIAARTAKYREA